MRRRKSATVPVNFEAGNQSHDSLDDFGAYIASFADGDTAPAAGGTLTINGEAVGSYDYVIKDGNETISAFSAGDWFTATEDSRWAVVVVKGDLTINSGQTLIPAVRKLGLLVYVTGTLTVAGAISMTARGANHSATGSNIAAAAIRIIDGTHSGVENPQVPATGGGGGGGGDYHTHAVPGSNGTAGGTGGGGGGVRISSTPGGVGAAGTSFTGGSAGGPYGGTAGAADGGPGGSSLQNYTSGSAGNPGGTGSHGTGLSGTGGVLVCICGTLAGAGAITAAGANGGGGVGGNYGGSGSGGGSITVLYEIDTSSITPMATGGAGGASAVAGANGGAGTARKLERAA